MIVFVNNEDFYYDIKTYLKVYYPEDPIQFVNTLTSDIDFLIQVSDEKITVAYFEQGFKRYEHHAKNQYIQKISSLTDGIEKRKLQKRVVKLLLYELMYNITRMMPPWGILTGIRPTKVVFKLMEQYPDNEEKIKSLLREEYRISEDKIDLMLQVANKEYAIISKNKPSEISLYIGIPFCPSKCLYCSFTSYPINKWYPKVDAYLDALKKELEYVSKQLDKDGSIPIRSIYIGGGTPTSLDDNHLEKLLKMIQSGFCLNHIEEFTIEAGRPDTITENKLRLIKQYGGDRISINPQTMNNKTLAYIGRKHTAEEIYEVYNIACKIGFKTINMDVIVGLPGERLIDVEHTMRHIKNMAPNNLTVHTLAYKRGSRLLDELPHMTPITSEEIGEMIEICKNTASEIGLEPYYLYRQKHMVGNFENVGYAKKGHECIYNVEIIEEKANILALGVGGISKISKENGKILDRSENLKDVSGYINRIDEIIDRKRSYIQML